MSKRVDNQTTKKVTSETDKNIKKNKADRMEPLMFSSIERGKCVILTPSDRGSIERKIRTLQ